MAGRGPEAPMPRVIALFLLAVLPAQAAAQEGAAEASPSCELRLAAIAHYTPQLPREEPTACAADDLVRLDSVVMGDRSGVAFDPPPVLRCAMAEAVTQWLRADVVPLAAGLGAPLAAVRDLDAYECRPRNRVPGAKISEHGRGNALDIGALKLGNGGVFALTDALVDRPFREGMRASACARFTTVLGPGSDGYHNGHVHLDLAERSHGYRICQWNVRDPSAAADVPLPQPKPAALIALQTRPLKQRP
jgi:hypothetical protein